MSITLSHKQIIGNCLLSNNKPMIGKMRFYDNITMTLKQAFAVIRHNCSVNGRIQQHIIIIISYLLTIVSIYVNCIVLDMFIILQYHPNDSE